MAPDPIEAAIEAAESPAAVPLRQFQVRISSTGRPCVVALPVDATDGEIAELAGWLLVQVMGAFRAERAKDPRRRILLPVS